VVNPGAADGGRLTAAAEHRRLIALRVRIYTVAALTKPEEA
jgi:hypothetical protein